MCERESDSSDIHPGLSGFKNYTAASDRSWKLVMSVLKDTTEKEKSKVSPATDFPNDDGNKSSRMLMSASLNKKLRQQFQKKSSDDAPSCSKDPDYCPSDRSDSDDSTVSDETVQGAPSNMEKRNEEAVGVTSSDTNDFSNNHEYTKKGTIRKRRKFKLSLSERKKQKLTAVAENHSLKSSCAKDKCRQKCTDKIPESRRLYLNREFWKLTSTERKAFILHHVSTYPVKQRTTIVTAESNRRNQSHEYRLKDTDGTLQKVCKVFFLGTLGYNKGCDNVIRHALKNSRNAVVPALDKRGNKSPHNKMDDEVVQQHIMSYKPTISHYRREHAPNRLYLPSDLSFSMMHKQFNLENPQTPCSYEKYRVLAKQMNISIVKLGHEECESCEIFNLHDTSHTQENIDENYENCESCNAWKLHIEKANKSRKKYREDAERDYSGTNSITYCADLEKVIMLPRLEMFKTAIFTHRLPVYNESFVPVGKKQKNCKPFAAVWHDALLGRNKEQIISTFYNFFKAKRDVRKITMWLDNCTAQNKNWAFFSFLIFIINSDEITTEEIELKYFEPGHTFMAADSFHHSVELAMKRMGKIYDFEDFVQAVRNASRGTEVLQMQLEKFYNFEDYSSQYKLNMLNPRPYIQSMVQVSVHRGSYTMKYKTDFEGEYLEINFLNSKITKNNKLPKPKLCTKVNGISKEKKKNIIQNMGGIITKNRLQFWENLPTSD